MRSTLRFIKHTFWIDVLLLTIVLLWMSACTLEADKETVLPEVQIRNSASTTRGKDVPQP